MCKIASEMFVGDIAVERIIARPFIGESGSYKRTANRKDFALDPFNKTMPEYIKDSGSNVMAVGKIEDIYNGKGIADAVHIKNNRQNY